MKIVKRLGIGVVVFVVALYSLVWLLSPLVVRHVLTDILAPRQLTLSGDSVVRLNPFTSRVSINDLVFKQGDSETYHLTALYLDYSLWRLLTKEVRVDRVTVEGMTLKLEKSGDKFRVAGLSLPAQEGAESEAEIPTNTKPSEGLGFTISAPEIVLMDITFLVVNQGQPHRLHIDNLEIARSLYRGQVFSSSLAFSGQLDGAELAVKTDVSVDQGVKSIELDLSVDNLQPNSVLYLLPDSIKALAATAKVKLNTSLSLTEDALRVEQASVNITVNDGQFADELLDLGLTELNFSIENLQANMNLQGDISDMATDLQLQLTDLAVDAQGSGDKLLGLNQFNSGVIKLRMEDGVIIAQSPEVVFEKIVLSTVSHEQELPPLFSAEQLRISELEASAQSLQIASIELGASVANVHIAESGELVTLFDTAIFSADQASEETTENKADVVEVVSAPEQPAEHPQQLAIRLGEFKLADPLKILVDDKSHEHRFSKTFELTKAEINNIDTSFPDQQSNYMLEVRDAEYFRSHLSGWVKPFTPKLNLVSEGELREFPLYEVAPYLRDALGFEVERGQLDVDLKATVTEDALNSSAKILLRGASFKGSQKSTDESNLIGQTAIPLNVALDMLKDSKGNIKLKIPVKGDVNDPSFDASHVVGMVIRKVAMAQAKSYLMTMFVPYSEVVSVAMAAGSAALKIRFEDLSYAPEQTLPAEQQNVFLQQLGLLMTDKKNLVVSVCGIATPEDILLAPGATLTPEQYTQAIAVADARAKAIKARLIKDVGVESQRLHLCSPKVDYKKTAVPRVEFKT